MATETKVRHTAVQLEAARECDEHDDWGLFTHDDAQCQVARIFGEDSKVGEAEPGLAEADAKHLALRWNSHDALLAACQETSEIVSLINNGQDVPHTRMHTAFISASAAIALAQGE